MKLDSRIGKVFGIVAVGGEDVGGVREIAVHCQNNVAGTGGEALYAQRGRQWCFWTAVTCRRFGRWRSHFFGASRQESGSAAKESGDMSPHSKFDPTL